MTKHARVRFEPESLERTGGGTVVGKIWVEIDGASFPGEGWFDFVPVILVWWLEALREFSSHGQANLRFMDGPYLMRAVNQGQGRSRLDLIRERRSGEDRRASYVVDMNSFLEAVNEAARRVVIECETRGWAFRDLDSLRREMVKSR
jgi:hypothetical protein